jgi:hypothetical protein
MIIITSNRIYRLIKVLYLLIIVSCNPANRIENYYTEHKTELLQLTAMCDSVKSKYGCGDIVMRSSETPSLYLRIKESGSRYCVMFFKNNELGMIDYGDTLPGDVNYYSRILKDIYFEEIIRLYFKLEPDAMDAGDGGVFLALSGVPMKRPTHYDAESGIYISYNEEKMPFDYYKQIDTMAYLQQWTVN